MTDHLPECPFVEACNDEIPEHGYCSMQHGVFCIHCHQWCICDALRACEQRLLNAAREAVEGVQRWHEFSWGLDDDDHGEYMKAEDALAAIDALRQKP